MRVTISVKWVYLGLFLFIFLAFFVSINLYFHKKLSETPSEGKKELPAKVREFNHVVELLRRIRSFTKNQEVVVGKLKNPFYEERSIAGGFGSKVVLKVNSILLGDRKVCLVNDRFYKEGDRISPDIKVLSIGDYYVDFKISKKGVIRVEVGSTYSF